MAISLSRKLFLRKVLSVCEYSSLTIKSCTSIRNGFGYTNPVDEKIICAQYFVPKYTVYNIISKPLSSSFKPNDEKRTDENKETEKLSLFQKFKQMYRDYWYVLVPVHLVTSAAWFGGFYYMAKSGIDIVALLESWHVSERVTNPLKDSSMGYLAVSYALYKIATPARYTVTLGGTTISINYLKKWGYIKPVPSTQEMKQMYQEKKETITKSMKDTKGSIIETKDHLIETLQEKKEGIKEKKDSIIKTVSKSAENLKKQKYEIKGKLSHIKNVKEKT